LTPNDYSRGLSMIRRSCLFKGGRRAPYVSLYPEGSCRMEIGSWVCRRLYFPSDAFPRFIFAPSSSLDQLSSSCANLFLQAAPETPLPPSAPKLYGRYRCLGSVLFFHSLGESPPFRCFENLRCKTPPLTCSWRFVYSRAVCKDPL